MMKMIVYLLLIMICLVGCRGSSDPVAADRGVVTTPDGVRGDPEWTKPVSPGLKPE